MPNVIKGNDLMLYVVANGLKTAVCYAKGCSLNISRDTKEITGRGLNGWRDYITGKAGYTIDVDGNMNAVAGSGKTLMLALLNGTEINFWFSDNVNFEWSGKLLVTNSTVDSPMDALATFSDTLLGKGKLQYKELPTSNKDPDQTGTQGKPILNIEDLEPFPESLSFIYDGTNNTQILSFVPRAPNWAERDGLTMSPFTDYYFANNTIVINPDILTEGVNYTILLNYFK